jgi:hypothetical protein
MISSGFANRVAFCLPIGNSRETRKIDSRLQQTSFYFGKPPFESSSARSKSPSKPINVAKTRRDSDR